MIEILTVFGLPFFVFNLVGLGLYLRYAQRKALLDQPNDRSSHQIPTVRGGGILFAPTFIIGILLLFYPDHYLAAIALLIAAVVSFVDDVSNLPARVRLPLHFVAVGLLIADTHLEWSVWFWILGLILVTGWMNAFNFMDGINGITSVYGSVFLISLWLHWERVGIPSFVLYNQLVFVVLVAVLVFSIFNFRKKAVCFAGDVGSVSLALIIAWFFLTVWKGDSTFYLLLFPAIYAVDSVMTIIFRLARKENIFKPHRSHLYQLLANEQRWDHRIVALLYGGLQVLLNLFATWYVSSKQLGMQIYLVIGVYLLLCIVYYALKTRLEHRKLPAIVT